MLFTLLVPLLLLTALSGWGSRPKIETIAPDEMKRLQNAADQEDRERDQRIWERRQAWLKQHGLTDDYVDLADKPSTETSESSPRRTSAPISPPQQ